MLTLYRRHNQECGRKDRYWKRCQCAMWVEGTLDRQYMRKSLHTQSWERARSIVDEWERTGAPKPKSDLPTIEQASKQYVADCIDRNFAEITVTGHRNFLARFSSWCQSNNYHTIGQVRFARTITTVVNHLRLIRLWILFNTDSGILTFVRRLVLPSPGLPHTTTPG